MIEARRTEEPGGWSEGLTAPYNLIVGFIHCVLCLIMYLMISSVMMTSEMLRPTLEILQQKNTNTIQMIIEARLISFFTDCLLRQWEYLKH